MKIIETSFFTKKITGLLSPEEYRNFQNELIENPTKGKTIRGNGGLRKIRLGLSGRGKSGGTRIIYYWLVNPETIMLPFAYPKNEKDNLTPNQLKILKHLVEEEIKK